MKSSKSNLDEALNDKCFYYNNSSDESNSNGDTKTISDQKRRYHRRFNTGWTRWERFTQESLREGE